VLIKRATIDKRAEVLLECVSAGSRQCDRLANCHAAVLAGVLDDLKLKFRHGREHDLLTLDLHLQSTHLFR